MAQQRLLDKLEKLKLWQEEEKEKLLAKQQSQRKTLNEEHKKLFEVFGEALKFWDFKLFIIFMNCFFNGSYIFNIF